MKYIKATFLVLLVIGGLMGFGGMVGAQSGSQNTQQFLFPAWLNEYLMNKAAHPSGAAVTPHMAVLVGSAYPKMVNGAPYGEPYSWAMALTGYGKVVWGESFSGAMLSSVINTGDGYVMAGATHEWVNGASPATNAWVAKLAPNGSVVWQEAIGPNAGPAVGAAYGGGNVVVAGNLKGMPWLVALDSSGKVVWQKIGSGNGTYEVSSIAGGMGSYVVGGYKASSIWTNGAKIAVTPWVAEIGPNGNIIWQETFNISNTAVSKVYVAPNGHILIIGSNHEGSWIVCLSGSGMFIWGKEYTGVEISAATFSSTGNVILVGSKNGQAIELVVQPGGETTAYSLGFTGATAAGAVGNSILIAGYGKSAAYVGYAIPGTGLGSKTSVNSSSLKVSVSSTNLKLVKGGFTTVSTSLTAKPLGSESSNVWNWEVYALLDVETSPSSAAVYVDGNFAGRTPLYYYVTNGVHMLKIAKANYAEIDKLITVATGEVVPIQESMVPGGYINVNTVPSGALVYVDGQFIGQTPVQNYSIPSGFHILIIKKPGYVTVTKFITVGIGQTVDINKYLLLAGYLRVITRPKGAAVYIDGQYIQDTPIENYTLPLGVHEVTIVKNGYVTYDKFITVTAGSLNVINVTLQMNGTLYVVSTPSGASVYINGKYMGKTPLKLSLVPGNYTVKIEKSGYQTAIRHVELTSNATMSVGAVLQSG